MFFFCHFSFLFLSHLLLTSLFLHFYIFFYLLFSSILIFFSLSNFYFLFLKIGNSIGRASTIRPWRWPSPMALVTPRVVDNTVTTCHAKSCGEHGYHLSCQGLHCSCHCASKWIALQQLTHLEKWGSRLDGLTLKCDAWTTSTVP